MWLVTCINIAHLDCLGLFSSFYLIGTVPLHCLSINTRVRHDVPAPIYEHWNDMNAKKYFLIELEPY